MEGVRRSLIPISWTRKEAVQIYYTVVASQWLEVAGVHVKVTITFTICQFKYTVRTSIIKAL